MGRRRLSTNKKRVLQVSNKQNSEFLWKDIPELKEPPVQKRLRLGGNTNRKKTEPERPPLPKIDLPDENAGSQYATLAGFADTSGSSSRANHLRTYSREQHFVSKTVRSLAEDWDTDEDGSINENSRLPTRDSPVAKSDEVDSETDGENSQISCPQTPTSYVGPEAHSSVKAARTRTDSCGTDDEATLADKQRQDCFCGLSETVDRLNKRTISLQLEKQELRATINRLQKALVSKLLPEPERPFSDVEGFPGNEVLMKMSEEADDSDYKFIKFLMEAIWPQGFAGRSVTGRQSNNPSGRPKGKAANERERPSHQRIQQRIPLEAEKVNYVKDRLYERRIFLRDKGLVAAKIAYGCKRLMTRVLSNMNKGTLK